MTSFFHFASSASKITESVVKDVSQNYLDQPLNASDANKFSAALSGNGQPDNNQTTNSGGGSQTTNDQTTAGQEPDPAIYDCHRPLGALGGSGTHSGPDISINPFSHGYLCVHLDGEWTCGGQTSRDGDLWGPGAPSNNVDTFDPDRCELISTDKFFAECTHDHLVDPWRPEYGLFGSGTNCHEWKADTIDQCEEICENWGDAAGNDYDIDWGGGFEVVDDNSYDIDFGSYDNGYDVLDDYDIDYGTFRPNGDELLGL